MKFKIMPSELNRWYIAGRSSGIKEDCEFREWMSDYYPECECRNHFNNGEPYWAVRGGDPGMQAMILLRWHDDE